MKSSWFKNIFEKLQISLNFKKVNSPSLKAKDNAILVATKSGSINIQQGLSASDAVTLINEIIKQQFVSLREDAKTLFDERIHEFENYLFEKIKALPEEEIAKLRDPDTQLALLEAVKISGRKQNDELRNLLANLVINRIKNDKSEKEELKNIVYNEAIHTVNKLTADQLKILSLFYILRYTINRGIDSWSAYNEFLNKHIKPFLDFNNTITEFRHIEYAGCGSIDIGEWSLITIIKEFYFTLFLMNIDKKNYDKLNISNDIKNDLFSFDNNKNKYLLKFKNRNETEEYFQENKIKKEDREIVFSFIKRNLISDADAKAKIIEKTEIGNKLLDLWENSLLKHLDLTSVGIAIGASYFEQRTGVKINIDIWIN